MSYLHPLPAPKGRPALAVGAPTSWGDYSPLMSGNRGRLDRIRAGSSWWLPAPESLGPSPPSDCPRPTAGRLTGTFIVWARGSRRAMKTTIFTWEFPPNVYGGAGVHAKYIARSLSKLIEVEVRTLDEGPPPERG